MFYKLKLIDSSSGKIELNDTDNQHYITNVKFSLLQDEKLASERATDIHSDIEISGTIDDEHSQEQTRLFLEWAQEAKDLKKVYKHLTVEVWKGNDDLARRYELDNVYCVSYTEDFKTDNQGTFNLKMAQKKGNLGSIKFASK